MAHEVQDEKTETEFFHSSWLSSATYDPQSQALNVYTSTGRSYSLTGVPPDVWRDFKEADSAGRFFNDRLKGHY